MLESHIQNDIDRISNELLRQSKAYDIFPTPIEKIVQYAELNVAGNINLSEIEPAFFEKFSETLKTGFEKVRGILDRDTKIIYLDLSQKTNRKNFVQLHEVGHDVLPWQKATLQFLDDDSTLDINTKTSFEAEANYFASTTLFQQDRFVREINKLPLELKTSLHLSKYFGGSVHATLRRYVEYSKNRCALLVLENFKRNGYTSTCEVRNYFQSKSFTDTFNVIKWEKKLSTEWEFVQDIHWNRRMKQDGIFSLPTKNGGTEFHYHYFNNSYNTFILFFPKGESKKSRFKFVLQE